jgi:hypothetical protein
MPCTGYLCRTIVGSAVDTDTPLEFRLIYGSIPSDPEKFHAKTAERLTH